MSSSDEDSNDESNHRNQLLTVADRLLEVAEHGTISTNGLLDPGGGGHSVQIEGSKFRSIEERLLQLHIEESAKAAGVTGAGKNKIAVCSLNFSLKKWFIQCMITNQAYIKITLFVKVDVKSLY